MNGWNLNEKTNYNEVNEKVKMKKRSAQNVCRSYNGIDNVEMVEWNNQLLKERKSKAYENCACWLQRVTYTLGIISI